MLYRDAFNSLLDDNNNGITVNPRYSLDTLHKFHLGRISMLPGAAQKVLQYAIPPILRNRRVFGSQLRGIFLLH
jgi:hypothetical protein